MSDQEEKVDNRRSTSIANKLIIFVVLGNFTIAAVISDTPSTVKETYGIKRGFERIEKSVGKPWDLTLYGRRGPNK